MRHEYHDHLELTKEQRTLLDNHSLLNLFNVMELQLAGLSVELPDASIREYSRFCLDMLVDLPRINIADRLPELKANCQAMRSHLVDLKKSHPGSGKLLDGLIATTDVGHARLMDFEKPGNTWISATRDAVADTLETFLKATSAVSGERFGFVFSPDPPRPRAYWIDFQIGFEEGAFSMPATLNDTIRDLVSNSRKYSEPGSAIRIRLDPVERGGLRLVVTDEGVGIPEQELPMVVEFGYRATNVIDRRTMGGGIGLTRAYQLSRQCGGQFWIESNIGKGTTITLTLYPPSGTKKMMANGLPSEARTQ